MPNPKCKPILLAALMLLTAQAYAADAQKVHITDQPFDADLFTTEGSTKKLGVIVLGGSEGGKSFYFAKPFAQAGYPTLALAYFKTKTTPDTLEEIPLEYFSKALEWFNTNENIPNGIVVAGASKGAELSLLLATEHPQIKGVIALAPSSVVWQGIPKTIFGAPRSSWTLDGKPVPFVPYNVIGFDGKNYLSLHKHSLQQKEAVEQATIPVEKINGSILLLSGGQDPMWPSTEMGDAIGERLKAKGFSHKFEHIKYDDAGHTLNEYFMLGGTTETKKKHVSTPLKECWNSSATSTKSPHQLGATAGSSSSAPLDRSL
jgi:uncharacterized protein